MAGTKPGDVPIGKFDILATYIHAKVLLDRSIRHERLRRLMVDAIVLARSAILGWTFLFLVLLASLIDILDFTPGEAASVVLCYAGGVAAIGLAVGAVGLLISGGILSIGRLKQLAARRYAPEPEDRDVLWDKWLDEPEVIRAE
jgi:hypothetical protein